MKTTVHLAVLATILCVPSLSGASELDRYNVAWTTPSKDASGSMPIGNGEVGLNVWVEEDGDLLFYIARTDAWSECNRLLKLGRVRVSLSPNPFTKGQTFRQELVLRDGQILVTAADVKIRLFVDADAPVIHLTGESTTPHTVTARLEVWRTEKKVLKKGTPDEFESCWTMYQAPDDIEVWESPDVVDSPAPNTVGWYHRNAYSVVPLTLKHQSMESAADLVDDPLLNRTFGGQIVGKGFVSDGSSGLKSSKPMTQFTLAIAAHSAQTPSIADWQREVTDIVAKADAASAAKRTTNWWNEFWKRSWVFVAGEARSWAASSHELRIEVDSNGQSRFSGRIVGAIARPQVLSDAEIAELADGKPDETATEPPVDIPLARGFSVAAWIKPAPGEAGRIFDKVTAGGQDGFLFDTYPSLSLRLNVGGDSLAQPDCLKPDQWQHAAATVNATTGVQRIYLNGKLIAEHTVGDAAVPSRVTQAYILQRWITACGGRGNYPIKFNGSIFTVDPKFSGGPDFNVDWRRWGDSYWWQNTRLPYFPMIARGDFDQLQPVFRMYRSALPLAKARTKLYHDVEGAYFPETMTNFGTYANNDYGWDRTERQPNDIKCMYWRYCWQQGLELVALMLDYYEHTEDAKFLDEQMIPMAHEVLRYYDTRFGRDPNGKLVITPTQSVETYWFDVVNDTPNLAGLHDVTNRLLAIPADKTPAAERELWEKMKTATPALPLQTENGKPQVMPAEKFNPQRNNCENPGLYTIWPFRIFGLGRPDLETGVETFLRRIEKASIGWQYDGQCAALVGLTDEAKQILLGKVGNSNPNHRFPAMWGPNYDWLPDQDHGSNIMLTLQNMLLQSADEKIFVLPAWPAEWDVSFKLHAPRRTTVECVYRNGQIQKLVVLPQTRRKDVVLPN